METISITAVADILDLHAQRIEQWISRGQFVPRESSVPGKKRGWDVTEVMRLAVFAKLANQVSLQPAQGKNPQGDPNRLSIEEAGRLTQSGLYGFVDDEAFLVCYKTEPDFGWFTEIVRKRDLGDLLSNGCFMPTVLMEGRSEEAMRYNSRNITVPAEIAVIVNLDRIEKHVKASWPTNP